MNRSQKILNKINVGGKKREFPISPYVMAELERHFGKEKLNAIVLAVNSIHKAVGGYDNLPLMLRQLIPSITLDGALGFFSSLSNWAKLNLREGDFGLGDLLEE